VGVLARVQERRRQRRVHNSVRKRRGVLACVRKTRRQASVHVRVRSTVREEVHACSGRGCSRAGAPSHHRVHDRQSLLSTLLLRRLFGCRCGQALRCSAWRRANFGAGCQRVFVVTTAVSISSAAATTRKFVLLGATRLRKLVLIRAIRLRKGVLLRTIRLRKRVLGGAANSGEVVLIGARVALASGAGSCAIVLSAQKSRSL